MLYYDLSSCEFHNVLKVLMQYIYNGFKSGFLTYVLGFLVDRFGEYKPVVITALILNAAFHHSLLLIPHQETPGVMPSAYVMQHPGTGDVEVSQVLIIK